MLKRRAARKFPLRYDDGFRGGIVTLLSLPTLVAAIVLLWQPIAQTELVFALMCGSYVLFFIVYLFWTHLAFSRANAAELEHIAALQHGEGVSGASKLIGLRTSEEWAMFAAGTAMAVAVVASIIGAREGGLWLPLFVLVTVVTSWATVVYAFALRYLRLHCGGETISFDIEESPGFTDFVSMSVMVSSMGAISGGSPRTRAGLTVVRKHTFISFIFNALVVAMVVSLMTGFIAAGVA